MEHVWLGILGLEDEIGNVVAQPPHSEVTVLATYRNEAVIVLAQRQSRRVRRPTEGVRYVVIPECDGTVGPTTPHAHVPRLVCCHQPLSIAVDSDLNASGARDGDKTQGKCEVSVGTARGNSHSIADRGSKDAPAPAPAVRHCRHAH